MTRNRKIAIGLLFLTGLGLAAWYIERSFRPDQEKLQGEWALKSAMFDGDSVDPAKVRSMGLLIEDDVWTNTVASFPRGRSRVQLAPKKRPKEFEQSPLGRDGEAVNEPASPGGPRQPIVRKGIYELDGHMLRIALSRDGEGRPKDFQPEVGKMVYTYKWAGK